MWLPLCTPKCLVSSIWQAMAEAELAAVKLQWPTQLSQQGGTASSSPHLNDRNEEDAANFWPDYSKCSFAVTLGGDDRLASQGMDTSRTASWDSYLLGILCALTSRRDWCPLHRPCKTFPSAPRAIVSWLVSQDQNVFLLLADWRERSSQSFMLGTESHSVVARAFYIPWFSKAQNKYKQYRLYERT